MEEMNQQKNKVKKLLLVIMPVLVIVLIGVTFAFFNYTRTGVANRIQVGKIYFNTTQNGNINLTNIFPIEATPANMSDNTKVGTVTIDVVGETTYDYGVEYLVSAVDVNNTVNDKIVPISIDVSYGETSGETIGTEDNSYFSNRGGETSIYQVLANGTIENNNDRLLVGYITKGQTGIDGTITIKAYLDKNELRISDTYDGTESDNMGTTSEWAGDKIVLTTSEWNTLHQNGISFKVKVEAQEGTWVNELTAAEKLAANARKMKLENVAGAYRYVGSDPDNYVWFNNEQWRIIGVYDNQLKIVRAETLSGTRQYNAATSDGNVWGESALAAYLNGDYYNGLSETAKEMIAAGTWNVGKLNIYNNANLSYLYSKVEQLAGKNVGLIAPYEYLYAAGKSCREVEALSKFSTECANQDWLKQSTDIWTLSARYSLYNSNSALYVLSNGNVNSKYVNTAYSVLPVVYLHSSIIITGGNGKIGETNSYKLGFEEEKTPNTINLSSDNGTIYVGESVPVSITLAGEGDRTCSSSDSAVATCNINGDSLTINGLAAGNATITVNQVENSNRSGANAIYNATVKEPFRGTAVQLADRASIYELETVDDLDNIKIFSGSDPDNYVWFNNEQWRILGVYGNKLKLIKAMPSDSSEVIEKQYDDSYDFDAWEGSTSETYLNGEYYDGLSAAAKEMIVAGTWYAGATDASTGKGSVLSEYVWAKLVPVANKNVGLIATYEVLATGYEKCQKITGDYGLDCGITDWMRSGVMDVSFWTINPGKANYSGNAELVSEDGGIARSSGYGSRGILPVVYLNSSITITGGNGRIGEANSYKLGIEAGKLPNTVNLSNYGGTIYTGESTTVTITAIGDGAKTCSSSDNTVATCSISGDSLTINGLVAGDVTITVNQAASASYSATSATYKAKIMAPFRGNAAQLANNATTYGLETTEYGKIYVGSNPNNYVWFNNEQWRIIGVYGDKLKIIKAEPLAEQRNYNETRNDGNTWNGSALETYLNGEYYNGLSATAKEMIVPETWNLGFSFDEIIAETYAISQAVQVSNKKVGLIAAYEYLYAIGENFRERRSDYVNYYLALNWMDTGLQMWTLSVYSYDTIRATVVTPSGISASVVNKNSYVMPVVYLDASVTITGGNGGIGETNSYKLG